MRRPQEVGNVEAPRAEEEPPVVREEVRVVADGAEVRAIEAVRPVNREEEALIKVALLASHIFIVYVAASVAPVYFATALIAGGTYGYFVPSNPDGAEEIGGSLFQRLSNIHFHPAIDVAIATLATAEHMVHHLHHTNIFILRILSNMHLSVLLSGFCTGAQLSRFFFHPDQPALLGQGRAGVEIPAAQEGVADAEIPGRIDPANPQGPLLPLQQPLLVAALPNGDAAAEDDELIALVPRGEDPGAFYNWRPRRGEVPAGRLGYLLRDPIAIHGIDGDGLD